MSEQINLPILLFNSKRIIISYKIPRENKI